MKTVYIYALVDPRNNQVFYVGRTHDLDKRLRDHISEAQRDIQRFVTLGDRLFGEIVSIENEILDGNTQKKKRITEILFAGQTPEIRQLDSFKTNSIKDANRLEDAWIAKMKFAGAVLTNKNPSRRTRPSWYKTGKEGLAKNPDEYIQLVKDGKFTNKGGATYRGRKRKRKRRRRK